MKISTIIRGNVSLLAGVGAAIVLLFMLFEYVRGDLAASAKDEHRYNERMQNIHELRTELSRLTEWQSLYISVHDASKQYLAKRKIGESNQRIHSIEKHILETYKDSVAKVGAKQFFTDIHRLQGLNDTVLTIHNQNDTSKTNHYLLTYRSLSEILNYQAFVMQEEMLESMNKGSSVRYMTLAKMFFVGFGTILLLAILLASLLIWRNETARMLEKSRIDMHCLVNSMPTVLVTIDTKGKIIQLNRAAEECFSVLSSEYSNQSILEMIPELAPFYEEITVVDSPPQRVEKRELLVSSSKGKKIMQLTQFALQDSTVEGVVIRLDDITEQRHFEEQMRHNQKMLAIGQLAGGIAHDFNNSLGGIIGMAELLKCGDVSAEEQEQYLDMIIAAGDHASDLTKKLLAFSRKGRKISSSVDGMQVVTDAVSLLKYTVNKNVTISVDNRATQTVIVGDGNHLQNALMNIGINGSHAMPNGGDLSFVLENLELDAEYCEVSPFEIKPGEYLDITIRDTGTGMPQEVMTHIFEPFFTTKEQGKGTGLGMASVYGTVQEHNGAILVYSEVGSGTVFHIYLPVSSETVQPKIKPDVTIRGSGTILVIDDEELIRVTASAMLVSLGYKVICAENGLEGVKTFEEISDEVDLVILDMIMPIMGGRDTFFKLRELKPSIAVIIASGFAKEEDMAELKNQGVSGFLNKPFRKAELAEKVAACTSRKR